METGSQQKSLVKNAAIIVALVIFALIIYIAFFLHARVTIEVKPENAIVTIDNKPMETRNGKSSFAATLGNHTIKVEADNYIGYREEIILKRGRNYSKKVALIKAPVPLEISAQADSIAIQDNQIFYRNTSDQLIYHATVNRRIDGAIEIKDNQPITSKAISGVDKIIWSPTRELLLLKRGRTVHLFDFKKYDFVHQEEVLFGQDIGDIVWASDNSRIAYYYAPPGGEQSIIFSDKINGTKYRVVNLKELGISDPYLAFSPSSEWLIMIPRNQKFGENNIYLINVFTKTIEKINDVGDQKEAVFTSDSQKIIYSTYSSDQNNPYSQTLSVMELNGGNKKSLKIFGRATDVRYWNAANKIFLPRVGDRSKLMLYDLDSASAIDFYFQGQSDAEISEIQLSDDKSNAIFISKNKLYYIKLEGNG